MLPLFSTAPYDWSAVLSVNCVWYRTRLCVPLYYHWFPALWEGHCGGRLRWRIHASVYSSWPTRVLFQAWAAATSDRIVHQDRLILWVPFTRLLRGVGSWYTHSASPDTSAGFVGSHDCKLHAVGFSQSRTGSASQRLQPRRRQFMQFAKFPLIRGFTTGAWRRSCNVKFQALQPVLLCKHTPLGTWFQEPQYSHQTYSSSQRIHSHFLGTSRHSDPFILVVKRQVICQHHKSWPYSE